MNDPRPNKCPMCEERFFPANSESLPFCSERCRQLDLGNWLGEKYSMPIEGQEEAEYTGAEEEDSLLEDE
ncbi:MAG: DNA gyrase inhibitor YacG [Planctomycetales bacterium]|nr:DNA gyrase inhibitor YacG [Planctomycetales bacterium]